MQGEAAPQVFVPADGRIEAPDVRIWGCFDDGGEIGGFHGFGVLFFGLGFGIIDKIPFAPLFIFVFVRSSPSNRVWVGQGGPREE